MDIVEEKSRRGAAPRGQGIRRNKVAGCARWSRLVIKAPDEKGTYFEMQNEIFLIKGLALGRASLSSRMTQQTFLISHEIIRRCSD